MDAIEIEAFAPDRTVDTEFDYVWVGKFNGAKQPELFLDALAEYHGDGSFEAAMLGTGPREAEVRERVDRHELGDAVTLTGWIEDPATYLRRSPVYVSTSTRDALPLTLIEAMAAGLVCVAPRTGAIPELIHHGHNGFLYSPGDVEDLVQTLEWINERVDRDAVGTAAQRTASEYSYDVAADDWEQILWLAKRQTDRTSTAARDPQSEVR
jgi:glycosyltransferase involved in cell wall biosynthesis